MNSAFESLIRGLLDGLYIFGAVWGFIAAIGAVLFATTMFLFLLGIGRTLIEAAKGWTK